MTESDIAAIRDALAADRLTHGEWVACGPSFGDPLPRFLNEVVQPDDADGGEVIASAPAGGEYSADMAYIATVHPERIARLLDALEEWHTALSAVMPPDFKDWHQNDRAEWPAVAAGVIQNLRRDRDAALDALESAQREAASYRLLRAECDERFTYEDNGGETRLLQGEALDAAIDAAMRKGL